MAPTVADSSSSTAPAASQFVTPRARTSTISSVRSAAGGIGQSTRKAAGSIGQAALNTLNADPPLGAWAAAAQATSHAPTLNEIRQGAFTDEGWHEGEQRDARRRKSSGDSRRRSSGGIWRTTPSTTTSPTTLSPITRENTTEPFPAMEEEEVDTRLDVEPEQTGDSAQDEKRGESSMIRTRAKSSGYVPPPQLPWTVSSWIGFKAFCKWVITPLGFCITIYGLNVVAWGGMLFLLLCGAGPAMCKLTDANGNTYYDCNDINSPRRVWIEVDSQILNALFCVTGFGLIPWRFRDLYYLLRWRLCSERRYGSFQKQYGLRTLAGINKGWFRLPASETLDEQSSAEYIASITIVKPAKPTGGDLESADYELNDPRLPLPTSKTPPPPLTGVRAPPTALWKLDFFIWSQVWNTFLQACLCGFMWGMNRFDRPSWSTGLFIALACIVAGVGGIMTYVEGRRVKRVEGVRPSAGVEAYQNRMEQKKARELGLEQSHTGLEGGEEIHVADQKKGHVTT